ARTGSPRTAPTGGSRGRRFPRASSALPEEVVRRPADELVGGVPRQPPRDVGHARETGSVGGGVEEEEASRPGVAGGAGPAGLPRRRGGGPVEVGEADGTAQPGRAAEDVGHRRALAPEVEEPVGARLDRERLPFRAEGGRVEDEHLAGVSPEVLAAGVEVAADRPLRLLELPRIPPADRIRTPVLPPHITHQLL